MMLPSLDPYSNLIKAARAKGVAPRIIAAAEANLAEIVARGDVRLPKKKPAPVNDPSLAASGDAADKGKRGTKG